MQRDPTRLTAADIDALVPLLRVGLCGAEGRKPTSQLRPQTAKSLRRLGETFSRKIDEIGTLSVRSLERATTAGMTRRTDSSTRESSRKATEEDFIAPTATGASESPPTLNKNGVNHHRKGLRAEEERRAQDEALGIAEDEEEEGYVEGDENALRASSHAAPREHRADERASDSCGSNKKTTTSVVEGFVRFSALRQDPDPLVKRLLNSGTFQGGSAPHPPAATVPAPPSNPKNNNGALSSRGTKQSVVQRLYTRPATAGTFRPPSERRANTYYSVAAEDAPQRGPLLHGHATSSAQYAEDYILYQNAKRLQSAPGGEGSIGNSPRLAATERSRPHTAASSYRRRPLTAKQMRAIEATTVGTAPVVQPHVANTLPTTLSQVTDIPAEGANVGIPSRSSNGFGVGRTDDGQTSRWDSPRHAQGERNTNTNSREPTHATASSSAVSSGRKPFPSVCYSPRLAEQPAFFSSQRYGSIGDYLKDTKRLVYAESVARVAEHIRDHMEEQSAARERLLAKEREEKAEEEQAKKGSSGGQYRVPTRASQPEEGEEATSDASRSVDSNTCTDKRTNEDEEGKPAEAIDAIDTPKEPEEKATTHVTSITRLWRTCSTAEDSGVMYMFPSGSYSSVVMSAPSISLPPAGEGNVDVDEKTEKAAESLDKSTPRRRPLSASAAAAGSVLYWSGRPNSAGTMRHHESGCSSEHIHGSFRVPAPPPRDNRSGVHHNTGSAVKPVPLGGGLSVPTPEAFARQVAQQERQSRITALHHAYMKKLLGNEDNQDDNHHSTTTVPSASDFFFQNYVEVVEGTGAARTTSSAVHSTPSKPLPTSEKIRREGFENAATSTSTSARSAVDLPSSVEETKEAHQTPRSKHQFDPMDNFYHKQNLEASMRSSSVARVASQSNNTSSIRGTARNNGSAQSSASSFSSASVAVDYSALSAVELASKAAKVMTSYERSEAIAAIRRRMQEQSVARLSSSPHANAATALITARRVRKLFATSQPPRPHPTSDACDSPRR